MKIAGLSIWYIIAAIGIGLVVSFGMSYLQAPQPVDVHKVEITSVPTPAPVYVYVTQTQAPSPATPNQPSPEVDALLDKQMSAVDQAFNFLALGLFILAAVFIIAIMAGVMTKAE